MTTGKNPRNTEPLAAGRRTQRVLGRTLMGLMLIAVVVGWYSPWLYPFRMLVVYFHELSHALAVLATQGSVVEFSLNAREGGHVLSMGGNRFVALNAGYLGSLLWGVLLFQFARSSRLDRYAVLGIALLMFMTCVWAASVQVLILLLGMAIGLALLGWLGNHFWNDLMLRMLGVVSMIYVPLDILSDTIVRSHLPSDAAMLAAEFGGSTLLWGTGWLALAAITGFFVLRQSLR